MEVPPTKTGKTSGKQVKWQSEFKLSLGIQGKMMRPQTSTSGLEGGPVCRQELESGQGRGGFYVLQTGRGH